MAVVTAERLRGDLLGLQHRGGDVRDFALGAARILGRAVPFDGVCVLTMDPATRLPTSEVVVNGLPPASRARLTEIEYGEKDFIAFDALAHSEGHAASLSEATGGELGRSARHDEVKRPHGFGDELRAALVSDTATWGGLTLLRGEDRSHFTPADVALVGALSAPLAEGLRRAILLSALSEEQPDADESAGLLLLAPDNSVALADVVAEQWLTELRGSGLGDGLPPVVTAVASRARTIAEGRTAVSHAARARVRTVSGRWLLVRGTTLSGGPDPRTAVMLEPARAHELAPLIAAAYELTDRERAITQLIAQGLPTNAIARRLHISPWTVQDHLKAIFEKVGVGSRGELIARVFFDHYAPRLSEDAPLGADGWFAPPERAPQRGD